ncbi:GTPase-activating protein CIN2 [Sporobolomyces salmoneus]|uniref:GTPase-activating protein CIN2 n=1 Tax=Sporobolomyces salmoneus TaxID=183962 RepID=UPI00316CDF80
MDEAPLVFLERWTKSLRELESTLDAPSFDSIAAAKDITRLGSELTERAAELPSYEVGRCERELKNVLNKMNEKKTKSVPKSKFSFKRSTPAPSASATPDPSSGPSTSLAVNSSQIDPISPSLPSTPFKLSSRSNEYLCFDSLPSTNGVQSETLLLQDLSSCFVDLLPPSTGAFPATGQDSKSTFPTMYLSGLKDCTVLLPKIEGSIMVHNCQGCELVLGGHQFRMHNAKDCRMYLDTQSTPIIEGCEKLVFASYPKLFSRTSEAAQSNSQAKPTPSFVQDFDFPFATSEKPSPNWRFATEDEEDRAEWNRTEDEEQREQWRSHEAAPLASFTFISHSALSLSHPHRRLFPRRLHRVYRAFQNLKSPRPLAPRAPPSQGFELFPPHAPLGFFHSTQQITGLARHCSSQQYSRLTRITRLTRHGKWEEWKPRLGRKIAEDQKAAEEWKDAPWKWYETVGPFTTVEFAKSEARDPFAHEREQAEAERRRRESGRNGALPRVSAPAYRRRTPSRSQSPLFRPVCPSEPLHKRTFSSVSISTPFKLKPLPLALSYSTTTLARKNVLRAKFPQDTKIDLKAIMNDLRDLELLELVKGVRAKSAVGFKDAHRALYPLYHRLDQKKIPHVTFEDLDAALPELYTGAWTAIEQRLVEKKVHKLANLNEREKAMLNLVALHSIGAKRAEVFVAQKCKTAEDLLKADQKGKIKLSKAQKIGLLHREDFDRLIPREEMEKLKSALETALKKVDPKFECEILGSYRRGVGFSSDIDLAVRHKDFVGKDDEDTSKPMMAAIVKQLEDEGLIEEENQLMLGPKKYAGLMKLPDHPHYRRIDIRLAPYPSYPYMLLGTTGDSMLMKLMRHTAKKKGWCLNEFGMGNKYDAADENPNGFRPGTMKIVESEKEIFELLGFPYLEPEQRELSIWKGIFAKAGIPGLESLHRL